MVWISRKIYTLWQVLVSGDTSKIFSNQEQASACWDWFQYTYTHAFIILPYTFYVAATVSPHACHA